MVLELATIDIKPGTNVDFEKNLAQAQSVISQSEGYLGHEFQKCIERENRYVLLIKWATLEAHTESEKIYIGRVWKNWPTHVRVSIGTADEMAKFKAAFTKILG